MRFKPHTWLLSQHGNTHGCLSCMGTHISKHTLKHTQSVIGDSRVQDARGGTLVFMTAACQDMSNATHTYTQVDIHVEKHTQGLCSLLGVNAGEQLTVPVERRDSTTTWETNERRNDSMRATKAALPTDWQTRFVQRSGASQTLKFKLGIFW